ncbi:MAG: hypothetical protein WA118_09750 [Carboxydocellales bacterium]
MSNKVRLSKEQFDDLKMDKQFAEVLCLARVVNSMRFILLSGRSMGEGFVAHRDTTNSFFMAVGILHEGFRVVDRLGKYFSSNDKFREGFVKLRKSQKYKDLKDSVIGDVRNHISFHFFSDVIEDTLKELDSSECVLFSTDDNTWKTVHYDLADLTVINTMISKKPVDENESDYFSKIVSGTTSLCLDFVRAADELIADYFNQLNLKVEEM